MSRNPPPGKSGRSTFAADASVSGRVGRGCDIPGHVGAGCVDFLGTSPPDATRQAPGTGVPVGCN